MTQPREHADYLDDIEQAARKAVRFVQGMTFEQFASDDRAHHNRSEIADTFRWRHPMTLATVLNEVSGWPVQQQLELVETVWDRLVDSGWQPELSDEQRAELTRRLDDLKANPDKVLSHEEVLQHLRRSKRRQSRI